VQAPNEYTRVQAAEIEEPAEDVEIEFGRIMRLESSYKPFSIDSSQNKNKLVKFDFNDMGNV